MRLMLVPHPQRVQAMNLRMGEVRWGRLMHPTLDIRDMPDLYEVISRRFRDAGGVVSPPDDGGKGE